MTRRRLLLGMRDAERGRGDEEFALIAADGVQVERVVRLFEKEPHLEIVGFSGFGSEVGHGERTGTILEPRLPVDAEMVLSRLGREEEIRAALVGSHWNSTSPEE
jgi:hypothetical protein